MSDDDRRFMALALRLAARGLGNAWPNPAVGCVVVHGGRIVGRGWTQPGGRPHAEVEALRRAGPRALGATAYVSLEPCAHYGQTPPCTMALLHAGIRRAVVAAGDPDPRVNGNGLAQLKVAGVEVAFGLLGEQAETLNAGFFLKVRSARPLVTLKLATSADARIATRTGESQWITGAEARAFGHHLRATHDAILIGSGTALADDPELTCRLAGLEARSPVRVVLDGSLRLPATSRLASTARSVPTWLITRAPAPPERADPLRAQGVSVIESEVARSGQLDPASVLQALAAKGITRVLIEGGATIATAFLRARRVDRIAWFRAPLLLGGDGVAAFGALGVEHLDQAQTLTSQTTRALAADRLSAYIVPNEEGS